MFFLQATDKPLQMRIVKNSFIKIRHITKEGCSIFAFVKTQAVFVGTSGKLFLVFQKVV